MLANGTRAKLNIQSTSNVFQRWFDVILCWCWSSVLSELVSTELCTRCTGRSNQGPTAQTDVSTFWLHFGTVIQWRRGVSLFMPVQVDRCTTYRQSEGSQELGPSSAGWTVGSSKSRGCSFFSLEINEKWSKGNSPAANPRKCQNGLIVNLYNMWNKNVPVQNKVKKYRHY